MLHSVFTFCCYIQLLHSEVTKTEVTKTGVDLDTVFNRYKLLFINLSDSDIPLVQYRPHKNE